MAPTPADLAVHEGVMAGLRSQLAAGVLAALPPETQRVALLDYPMHENVGDHAIWAGELALLAELGIEVAYACDVYGYRRARVERQLRPGDPVLLHGGGNFGDLWPGFQDFRLRVIADLADRPVIQLPQTIHFRDPAAAERTGAALRRHGGVTLLVRDDPSAAFALEHLGVTAAVTPDAALALRPPSVDRECPVVWLRRADHEAVPQEAGPGPVAVDWPDHPGFAALRTAGRVHRRSTARVPGVAGRADRALGAVYARVSRRRVALGLRMLGRGEVVVTDRLHAHLLCCLIERPHVIVDNAYGKVGAFADRWTASSPLVHRAATHAEALATAAVLAGA